MDKSSKELQKVFTTLAFLIGLALIDELDSSEQNALGNWFMLIGQTLCTNGSLNFKNDFRILTGRSGGSFSGSSQNKSNTNKVDEDAQKYAKNLMTKVRNAIDKQINNL